MRIHIVGPVFEPTGYANLVRRVALGLDAIGADVTLSPMRWGNAPDALDPEVRRKLWSLAGRSGAPDVVLHVGPPEIFHPAAGAGKTVLFTMLESDRIPPHWVQSCNGYDEVWIPSTFNLHSFIASGVAPHLISVMPLGVDSGMFRPPPPGTRPHRPFTFLSVFEWIHRKGYRTLIPAFALRFRNRDARLLLKVQNNDRFDSVGEAINHEIVRLCEAAGAPEAFGRIRVVGRILSDEEMVGLYWKADAFVLPSSGEGWGFPIVEAAATGLPIVTTAWSGPMDYLSPDTAYLVPVKEIIPVPSLGGAHDRIYGGSRWAVPDPQSIGDQMVHIHNHPEEALSRGARLRLELAERYSWDVSIRRILSRLEQVAGRKRTGATYESGPGFRGVQNP